MTQSTELAEVPNKETALEIYTKPSGLEPWLDKIRSEVSGHVPDLKTDKGRKAIASLAHKVRKSKVALDDLGKELVDKLKDAPKKVDAERKRMRDTLDVLADEVRKPLTEWELAEANRVENHKIVLDFLANYADILDIPSGAIRESIADVESTIIDSSLEEFENEGHRIKAATLKTLGEKLIVREKQEAEQAELEKLRKEQAEREQKEREARIAEEAANRARQEAEALAIEEKRKADQAIADAEAKAKAERDAAEKRELQLKFDAENAERRRVEAEQKAAQDAKDAADRAEQSRLKAIQDEKDRAAAQVKAEADAAAKREANKAHARKINRAALDAMIAGGISEECGQKVISMIAKGEVPNFHIDY